MMKDSLEDRVAVVTGAAGTMGRAVVESLLAQSCSVAMVDIHAQPLAELQERLGSRALAVPCDIRDPGEVARAHARVLHALGSVSILVNNAGVLSNNKIEAVGHAEWRQVLSVNLDGALFWAQQVIPSMKAAGWGRIVNVGSLASKTGGLTAGTAYSVSKGAIGALTFSLARELAAHGVTVNAVAPAYVRTPMVTEQLTESQRDALLQQIPVRRFCEPEEFAHVVRFLASPLSGFITGEMIDLNGGLHMD
jgi:3-oxoacyl-[acyl-carrier protein] reductase